MKDIEIYAFSDEAASDLQGQINALKRNSLCGMEIRGVDGKNVSDFTPDFAREIKSRLDFDGLSVWSVGSLIGKINIATDDFSAHLEKFKNTLEIAEILDCDNIRLFSFFIPKEDDPNMYKNEIIDRLGIFSELADKASINLCHENEKGIYGENAENCLILHKALPSLKGVFDPANFVQVGQDTLTAWQDLKPYIKYMHIKDAIGEKVVPPGEGDGNLKHIVSGFIANGGNTFTIEPHLAEFVGFADLEGEDAKSVISTLKRYKDNDEAFDFACNSFKNLF